MSFVFPRRDICNNEVVGEAFNDEPGSVAQPLARVDILEKNDDCANLKMELVRGKPRDVKRVENFRWVIGNFSWVFGIDGVDTSVHFKCTRHFRNAVVVDAETINVFRTQNSSDSDFLCHSGIQELRRMTKYVVDQI